MTDNTLREAVDMDAQARQVLADAVRHLAPYKADAIIAGASDDHVRVVTAIRAMLAFAALPTTQPTTITGGHADTEGEAMERFAHLNCPSCGGSGHIDDTQPTDNTGLIERLRRADNDWGVPVCTEAAAALATKDAELQTLRARDIGWRLQCEEQQEEIATKDAEIAALREHAAEQMQFANNRIKDGIELGAVAWRMALEDIVRENAAALGAKP